MRYKWLLISRLFFLAALVFAFAQPFMGNDKATTGANKLQIIYLDNSFSMSVKKGARSVFDIAKDAARKQVQHAKPGSKFILLTNDKPVSYRPEQADKVFSEINATEPSSASKSVNQVLAAAQSILQNDGRVSADLYYYSDFQQSSFSGTPDKTLLKGITFYGLPVQSDEAADVYVDSAYLTSPVLQAGKTNKLVVQTRVSGKAPKENPVLNLAINGQVKSAVSLNFADAATRTDTLGFEVNAANWQKIELTVNDAGMRFDDTFRLTARCAPNLSVLVLNEGQPNPYIMAAFRAYNGFRLNQADIKAIPGNLKDYNLIIFNGVTHIDEPTGKVINEVLLNGQSVCLFPGKVAIMQQLNEGLKQIGDISIEGIDTAVQSASSLQQGSALVRDLFDRIPDNVQLPVANWHYIINSGLSANQQSVFSFRNGDPLLARYTPTRGQLYLCATSADLQSGNFPASYFFTPFLYQMAIQSGGSSIYAITAGTHLPVYIPLTNVAERATLHAFATNVDVIPPQRPNGAGLDVFLDQAIQQPGFYGLGAVGTDTTQVALNQDKQESRLDFKDIAALRNEWKGDNVKWLNITEAGSITTNGVDNLPIWKICIFIAAIALAIETFLLAKTPKLTTS